MDRRVIFTESEIKQLRDKGFTMGPLIGQGATSDVFSVIKTNVGDERVAKVYVDDGSLNSLTARINTSGRNLPEMELESTRDLSHPYLDDVQDVLDVNGKRILIKRRRNEDLEQRVSDRGPLSNEEFESFFGTAIEALQFMHRQGYVHRDVKPSNFFVDHNVLILGDLQNKGRIDELERKSLPTKGGTAYTIPMNLEEIASGKGTVLTTHNDVYALGASMYFALTGEHFENFTMEEDENGTPLDFAGSDIKVSIKKDGEVVDWNRYKVGPNRTFGPEKESKLSKVPRKYRKLLHEMLQYGADDKPININQVKHRWNEATKTTAWPMALRYGSAIAAGTLLFLGGILHESKTQLGPGLDEILTSEQLAHYDGSELPIETQDARSDFLKKYLVGVQDIIRSGETPGDRIKLEEVLEVADQVPLDRRLVAALIGSIDANFDYLQTLRRDSQVLEPYFLPKESILRNHVREGKGYFLQDYYKNTTEGRINNVGELSMRTLVDYLKLGFDDTPNIAEIFSHYFLDQTDLNSVKRNVALVGEGSRSNPPLIAGRSIPVNTALALYEYTNEDGSFDTDAILALDLENARVDRRMSMAYGM